MNKSHLKIIFGELLSFKRLFPRRILLSRRLLSLSLFSLLIILSLTIAGCINYKTSQPNAADKVLLKEIEAIEQELELDKTLENETSNTAELIEEDQNVEEVVLPVVEIGDPSVAGSSATEQTVTIKENQKVVLKPKVADPDNDKVTITYSQPFNQNGEWKTKYGDAGEYSVTVTASDGITATTKQVKIIVEKDNVAPVVENLKDLTVNEGDTVTFTPQATDLNGDKITVTVSQPLEAGLFKTNFTSAGAYQIKVTASDGQLETAKVFTLTVKNVNQKPVIMNQEEIRINEGETLTLTPLAEDPDGDELDVLVSEPVGADGIWKLGYTDHGEYVVTITASDGTDTVSQKVKIIVEDVNAPVEFIDIVVDVN